jgi:hypothetical protein
MAPIQSFPVEMLDLIFRKCARETRLAARQTCKQFKTIIDNIGISVVYVYTTALIKHKVTSLSLFNVKTCKFVIDFGPRMVSDISYLMNISNNAVTNIVINGPRSGLWTGEAAEMNIAYRMLCDVKKIKVHGNFPVKNFSTMKSIEEVVWDLEDVPFDATQRLCVLAMLPNIKKMNLTIDCRFISYNMIDFMRVVGMLNERNTHLTIDTNVFNVDRFAMFKGIKNLTIITRYIGIGVGMSPIVSLEDHDDLCIYLRNANPGVTFTFRNVKSFRYNQIHCQNPTTMTTARNGKVTIE